MEGDESAAVRRPLSVMSPLQLRAVQAASPGRQGRDTQLSLSDMEIKLFRIYTTTRTSAEMDADSKTTNNPFLPSESLSV